MTPQVGVAHDGVVPRRMIVSGDFNCPGSKLAVRRAEQPSRGSGMRSAGGRRSTIPIASGVSLDGSEWLHRASADVCTSTSRCWGSSVGSAIRGCHTDRASPFRTLSSPALRTCAPNMRVGQASRLARLRSLSPCLAVPRSDGAGRPGRGSAARRPVTRPGGATALLRARGCSPSRPGFGALGILPANCSRDSMRARGGVTDEARRGFRGPAPFGGDCQM